MKLSQKYEQKLRENKTPIKGYRLIKEKIKIVARKGPVSDAMRGKSS